MWYAYLAFLSGVAVETLYAWGVILIGQRQTLRAALLSSAWGAVFLLGVNESFRTIIAAAGWCLGLGVGTVVGIGVANEEDS